MIFISKWDRIKFPVHHETRRLTTWFSRSKMVSTGSIPDVPHSGRSGELNYKVQDWQRTTVRIVTYSAFISGGGKT